MMPVKSFKKSFQKQKGFTLIELIISITVLLISLSIISTLITPAEEKSVDLVLQIKASELAQSLMNDITNRAFDDNSDMSGGRNRCGEEQFVACTAALGVEGDEDADDRSTFDDVDDFNGFRELVNSTDEGLDGGYTQFRIAVTVNYAGGELEFPIASLPQDNLLKRITVIVTTPLGTDVIFTSHKANF